MPATTTPSTTTQDCAVVHTHGRVLLTNVERGRQSYAPCPVCGEIADDLYSMRIQRYVSRTYCGEVYGHYRVDQDMPVTVGHFECQRSVGVDYLDGIAQVEN